MKRDTFKKGHGTFHCEHCGRLTRRTQYTSAALCPECDEAAMIENGIADGDLSGEELAAEELRIADLHRRAVSKGGTIPGVSA